MMTRILKGVNVIGNTRSIILISWKYAGVLAK
jgi:hypothetical protein